MTDDRSVLRRIAWRELFPWLILLRTFRLAISPPVLLAAMGGAIVPRIFRWIGAYVFLTRDDREAMRRFASLEGYPPAPPPGQSFATQVPEAVDRFLPGVPSAVEEAFFYYVEPFWRLFHLDLPLRHAAYYIFVILAMVAAWAFFAGIITRMAVTKLGADQQEGIVEATRFVSRRYLHYLFAPLYPLLGVALIVLLAIPLGLLMRLDIGVLIAGVVWILVLLVSLVAVWLLVGVLFGWPLMWPAVSAEREGDAFEAFSRSYAYVYGKPLNYLFYAVIATLFGTLCWAVVNYGATMLVEFGFWAVSWGAGGDGSGPAGQRLQTIRELAYSSPLYVAQRDDFGMLEAGAALIGLALLLVKLVVTAFTFSFFWVNASAIYLLLRHDVDAKEMDEIYQPEDEARFAAARRAIAETPVPNAPPAESEATDLESAE
jgi:hypothetical protein